ncbi:MAG: hypothetical protein DDT22_00430 [candidate division WS2 bacterium]|nr:hypothetical protein [Candidatus Lithacetigena glycinireducens]
MSKYLVLMDTDKIKQYIYSVGKLKQIRGASSILAKLNKKEQVEQRVSSYGGKCIYAGGGQVMAIFNSDEKADEFIRAEQAKYEESDASITGIKEEHINSFNEVVKKAQIKLRRAKEEKVLKSHLITSPFFKTCQLCGVNPASKIKYEKFACTVCEKKIDKGEEVREKPAENPIYKEFLNYMKSNPADPEWEKAKFTEDLSELGKLSEPENYLGFIYADGNRIGERLLKLTTEKQYQEMSETVEKGLQESVFESLRNCIPKPSNRKIPFEFVILGGDDLILLTPAQKAIPIALEILTKFEKKTKAFANKIDEEKFTLSTGVIIAHSKFPIVSFTKLAEDLLKSAKKLNKEKWYGTEKVLEKRDNSTIDYLSVTTPSANPVEVIREKDLTYTGGGTLKLTQRPFTLEKAKRIVNIVKDIKKCKLSRSRLYSIYNSLFEGKNQSILNILSLLTRLKGEEDIKKLFVRLKTDPLFYSNGGALFPWNSLGGFAYDTPFLDILEIYDFIEVTDEYGNRI